MLDAVQRHFHASQKSIEHVDSDKETNTVKLNSYCFVNGSNFRGNFYCRAIRSTKFENEHFLNKMVFHLIASISESNF